MSSTWLPHAIPNSNGGEHKRRRLGGLVRYSLTVLNFVSWVFIESFMNFYGLAGPGTDLGIGMFEPHPLIFFLLGKKERCMLMFVTLYLQFRIDESV